MAVPQGNRERALAWLVSLVLVAGTLAGYWPVRHYDYVNYDDWVYTYDSPMVTRGLTWEGFKWALTSVDGGNWHPLVWLSHMLDYRLFGPAAGGHHLTNVLLHAANALLVFAALRAMTGALWRSAFAAALFAWHPLHVESVAWISERKDVLSTLFWLLTMWAYARYAQEFKVQGSKFKVYYNLAVVFFVCGLMCKAMLVTLPVVLLIMDWWPLKRIAECGVRSAESESLKVPADAQVSLIQALKEKAPFFVLSVVGCAVAMLAQGAAKAYGREGLWLRLENATVTCATYVGQFFWPVQLAIFYPFPTHIAFGHVVVAAAALGVISVGVIRFGARRQYLPAGWLWFLVTLLPVIGLVQVGMQSRADRYTYVPYIGLGLMVSWGLADLVAFRRRLKVFAAPAAAAALAAYVAATVAQVRYWKDSVTLYEHALAVTSRNFLAHNNLGNVLGKMNRSAEAMAQFKMALAIKPDYADAYYNTGVNLDLQGRVNEAISNYTAALAIRPSYPTIQMNLGSCYLRLGRTNEALDHFQSAVKVSPSDVLAREQLADLLVKLGRGDEAAEQFQEALRLDSGNALAYNGLGNARSLQGWRDEAVKMYSRALQLTPDLAEAHWNLGSALLQQGRTNDALVEMKKAAELSPKFIDLRRRLGDTLMKSGRAAEAVPYYETVATAEPTNAPARLAVGQAYLADKKFSEAETNFKEALRLEPDSPVCLDALARLHATCPIAAFRNGAEAVRLAERACELTGRKNPGMLDTLAAAYAEAGRFADAVKTAKEAQARAEGLYDSKTAEAARGRAKLYQDGKAYHEAP